LGGWAFLGPSGGDDAGADHHGARRHFSGTDRPGPHRIVQKSDLLAMGIW
jgi:hypothetical protein